MNKDKERLLEILQTLSVAYGDFTLASGMKSKYYVDGKLTTFNGEGALLTGKVMLDLIKSLDVKIDSAGGPTMGADPIVTGVGIAAHLKGEDFRCFAVRKKTKEHGRQKLVEGNFKSGDNVVIVEDVITTGGSIFQAVEAVEEAGGKIAAVIVIVDRLQGGREKMEERGYELHSLFTIDDILDRSKI